jgi:hypothetical protein
MRWRRNDGSESRQPELGKTRMAASNVGVDCGPGKIGQPAGVARVTAAPPSDLCVFANGDGLGGEEQATVISRGPLVPVGNTNRN